MPDEIYAQILEALKKNDYAAAGGKIASLDKVKKASEILTAYPGRIESLENRLGLERTAGIANEAAAAARREEIWEKTLPAVKFANAICRKLGVKWSVPEDPAGALAELGQIRMENFRKNV